MSLVSPKVLYRRSAARHGAVVVDDAESAGCDLGMKPVEHLDGRFIQIAVEPKKGPRIRNGARQF